MRSARVPALATTVFAAAMVTGCAQPPTPPPAAPAATATAARVTAVSAGEGQQVYDSLLEQIYGTTGQRMAANERQHYAWQAAMGGCMTAKGATFETPAWTPATPLKPSPGELLAFSPERETFGIAGRIVAYAKEGQLDNGAARKLTGEARAQWLKIQAQCNPATSKTEDSHLAEGMPALSQKFLDQLSTIQKTVAPTLPGDWAKCMQAAGLKGVQEFEDAYSAASNFPYQALAGGVKDPAAVPGFAEAAAAEKKIAATDWKCRSADAKRVVATSGEPLTVWAAANRAEIDTVAANWAKMPAARDAAKAAAMKISTAR
ncbi:hypothetical protein [Actinoplanes sp. M2I2]|uniref:hypothetical protein n=1 Tax=Actinoplanes sp. M2I2 TaxID=1734444 RepID=UPI0020210813|nr:hypothetical protein [Actinoplanes sp. M2I2]